MAKTTTLHLNGNATVYLWDSSITPASYWRYSEVNYYTYDNRGRQVLMIQVDTVSGDTTTKNVTAYDANGSTFNSSYTNSGNTWELSEADTTLLDTKGVPVRQVYYYLYNGSLELVYGYAYAPTYDANGNVSKMLENDYDLTSSSWVIINEIDITSNPDGSWKTLTESDWNGSSFVNAQKLDSFTWNKWDGNPFASGFSNSQPTKYVIEAWNGSAWVDSARSNTTYDANGGSDDILQILTAGKWVNSQRQIQSMDSKGNNTGYADESWNGTQWVQSDGNRSIYTYNSTNNIIQVIYQNYDTSITGYMNIEKLVYGDFLSVTGINGQKQPELAVSMYPNPASDKLLLQAKTNAKGNVAIIICNIEVQIMMQSRYTTEELSAGLNLPVQGLPSGIYILHIVSDQIDTIRKFNVQ